ncbi:peptidoglycan DD-metalloendopeptidase family protein [Staphylococcus pseudintermedius]|nr:peptidoglycan DD-metalloendopeptidase family protein [Staphylococcus pseudintermedius]
MAEDIRSMRVELSMQDMGVARTLGQVKQSFRTLKTELINSTKMFNYSEKNLDSYKSRVQELDKIHKASQKNLTELKRRYHEVGEAEGYASKKALTLQKSISEQEKELHFLSRDLESATVKLKQFEKAQAIDSSGFTKASKHLTDISSSLDNVSQKTQRVGQSLTNSITKPALIAGTAVGGIMAKFGWDRLVGFDSAKAKLDGLGYSTKEIGIITAQVSKAVQGGMATMAEGTDVAAGALASGVKQGKDLQKYIKLVDSASVGANRPINEMATIFNRISGTGRLMTEELNQIEDGLPGFSQAMAKHLGVSYDQFRKMVTEGQVSSDEFLTVMESFAGGMAGAYSNSWRGMLANTKAYIGQLGESLLGGVFEQSKDSLKDFMGLLQSDSAKQWAQETGQAIGQSFAMIIGAVKGVVAWWNNLDGTTQKVLGGIIKTVAISAIAFGPLLLTVSKFTRLIGGLFSPISSMLGLMGEVSGAMKLGAKFTEAFASVFPKLSIVIGALTSPIGLAVLAITGITTALVIAYKKSETFRNIVNGAISGVVKAFQWLWQGVITVLTPVGKALQSFGQQIADSLGKFWAENGSQFMQALNNIKTGFLIMWQVVKPIIYGLGAIFKAVFGVIVRIIQASMPVITKILSVGWSLVKYLIVSTWQSIKGVIQGALNVIIGIVKVFTGIFTGDFSKMWEGIKQIFVGAFQFIWNLIQLYFLGKIFGVFKLGFGLIKGLVTGSLSGIKGVFTFTLEGIWNFTKFIFSKIASFAKFIFSGLLNFFRFIFAGIKLAVTNPIGFLAKFVPNQFKFLSGVVKTIVTGLKNSVSAIFSSMKTVVVNIVKSLYNIVRGNFAGLRNNVSNITKSLKDTVINLWRILKNTVVTVVKQLFAGVRSIFSNLSSTAKNIIHNLKDSIINKWRSMKNAVINLAKGARDGVVRGFKSMYDKGVEWINKLKGFLSSAKAGFKRIATNLGKGVANGAISGLNAMIDGINWMSNKIMNKKLIKSKIPTLSTGTGASPAVSTDAQGRLTRPTKAIVNDKGLGNASGASGHRELIVRKSGKVEKPLGRNTKVSLKRGDAVLNGQQSKRLLPHFSTGTGLSEPITNLLKRKRHKHIGSGEEEHAHGGGGGGSEDKKVNPLKAVYDTVKGATVGTIKGLGKTIGDIMDWVEKPAKLISTVLSGHGVDFSNIGGTMGDVMSWAYSGLKDGLKSLVTGWFDEAGGGDGDAGYLFNYDIWQRFGSYTGGLNFNGGRHYGIDFGMPIGTPIYAVKGGIADNVWTDFGGGNSVQIKTGANEWNWYMHLSKQIAKQGQRIKAGQLIGKSGDTGNFVRGAHLHFQLMRGSHAGNDTAVDPMGWLKSLKSKGGGAKGSGASYASRIITQAQNILGGQYKSSYIHHQMMRVAKRESNYQPDAVNDWDINAQRGTPSKGMFQMIEPTFRANAKAGYGNFTNPLHQAISAMQYIVRQYGWGGFKRAGDYAYATGGVINTNGMYQLSEEGNHGEVVVPLNPARSSDAMKLIAYAQSKINGKTNNKRPNQLSNKYSATTGYDNSKELSLMVQQLEATREQNNLLMQILGLTKNIEQQPKGFNTNDVSNALGKKARLQGFNYGI